MRTIRSFYVRTVVRFVVFMLAFAVSMETLCADNNPLCFTAKGGAVTVRFDIKTEDYKIQTSTDNANWSDYTKVEDSTEYPLITLSNAGDKVYFRASTYPKTLTPYGSDDSTKCSRFYFTRVGNSNGTVEASGNIMSLFTPDCNSWVLPKCAFAYMFYNCTLLTKAPLLPATTFIDTQQSSDSCYEYMFYRCTALTTAPELPATTLSPYCYYHTFDSCISLVTPPELPARDLKNNCYQCMFQNCFSLTSVPELPAAALDEGCYFRMFLGCSALKINSASPGKAWSINATTSGSDWNTDMFTGTGGTFTGAPESGTIYYIASGNIKTTSGNGNWNEVSTWTPTGIPGDADTVRILHNITIPAGVNAHCDSVNIKTGALTVAPTASLHTRVMGNSDATKFVIQSDANGTGTVRFASGTAKATVQMYLKGVSKTEGTQLIPEWQYRGFIGQPDQNRNLSKVVIYQWFETTNDTTCWHQYYDGYKSQSATGNFDPWTGYSMANMTENPVTKSYTTTLKPTTKEKTFTLSRTSDKTAPHYGSNTAPNYGVNLITNSYSAPINLCDAGITYTNAEKTVYFFNTRTHSDYDTSKTMTAITTYPIKLDKTFLRTHNPYIPAGQSFAVIASADGAALRIPASAVSTINSGAMYAPANNKLPLVKITIDGDELYLVQVENCSADFDNGYDGTKLFSSKADQIYATNDYGKTAVNSDRTLLGQYIGFKPLVKTEHAPSLQMTISSRDLEGYEELYLYDRVADTYTKITDDDVTYTFTSTGEENERRFQIVGKATDGTEYRPKAQPRIEVAGGEIWLMNFERTDAPVIVTDATGKTLWSVNAKEGTKFTLPDLPKGVYIVSCGKVSTKYIQ